MNHLQITFKEILNSALLLVLMCSYSCSQNPNSIPERSKININSDWLYLENDTETLPKIDM